MWRSEVVLEGAFLDQTKREALVFLLGIEHEIGKLDEPLNRKALQQVIDQTIQRDQLDLLNFSIYALYIFNADGQILAHSKPGKYPLKQIDGTKAAVFQQGEISLGEEVEYARDPVTGIEIPKADIIIPLHHNGKVIAAVEVEINLEATIKRIQQFDDRYERELVTVFAICFIILLLFLWWEIHRLLIHPIQSLGAVTEKIAAGELSSREEQLGRDELGDLGRSVNRMADSIEQLFTEQEEAYLQMLQSLAKALEAKDAYTATHSGRVSKFSVQLGRRLGLDKDELKLLKQGALMHDLGKIGIAEQILNKPAPLDDAEYEEMQRHPTLTANIMRPLKRFKEFAEIAAWHHERWDGNGYPDGLKGEQIPPLTAMDSEAKAVSPR
ncbi:hypothetical protein BOW53_09120 [Solemya pervernicosa gill symbiont]|uniref:HD-GYP domain-containing protein n=1 Tax=Solemya pervernicosa gill symbiont TaxID=642797 RepID=A0A1T2L4Q8_9GAMM|nr:HD domain-containing phosphohydrolase [Solemya pervernicosa gill symbiont]OOZ40051.1 hypothetical protein BOW53_09120 [Solemya pervernicosa gill symbiont]